LVGVWRFTEEDPLVGFDSTVLNGYIKSLAPVDHRHICPEAVVDPEPPIEEKEPEQIPVVIVQPKQA